MKQLTIVRHAKAESAALAEVDFDRPLTAKGRQQILQVAPALMAVKPPPDRLLASPAKRAQQTADGLQQAVQLQCEAELEARIYEASAATLLDVLREQPDTAQHILLVGHNPGLEALVSALCSGDAARLNLQLSTASIVYMDLEVARWHQTRWGCGMMRLLLAPKFLKRYMRSLELK